jgi:hypothetical protein
MDFTCLQGWNFRLVGADNDVLAGHARLLAARQLGIAEVPVIQLGHLSERPTLTFGNWPRRFRNYGTIG